MAKFVPGESGNPGGRPKSAYLSELARAETDACIATLVKIRDSGRSPAAARIAAARELLDRGYGKAGQALTLAGDHETPSGIRIVFGRADGETLDRPSKD
jgi:hypothetical protein